MSRPHLPLLALAVLSLTSALAHLPPTSSQHAAAVQDLAPARPLNISLSARPEGVTAGQGSTLYAGRLLLGGVVAVDVLTGTVKQVVPDSPGRRTASGMWLANGGLFVAGGRAPRGAPPGTLASLYVYNTTTGADIAVCTMGVDGSSLNDVIAVAGTAFVTDSARPSLYAIDVARAVAGECVVVPIPLPADIFQATAPAGAPEGTPAIGANGIEAYCDGLLVVQSSAGAVYHVVVSEGADAETVLTKVVDDGEVLGGDGLTVEDGKLYVTQNRLGQITVFDLSCAEGGIVSTQKLGELASPLFRSPATSAMYDGYIYSVNSRFGDLPIDFATEFAPGGGAAFELVGVKNVFRAPVSDCEVDDVESGSYGYDEMSPPVEKRPAVEAVGQRS